MWKEAFKEQRAPLVHPNNVKPKTIAFSRKPLQPTVRPLPDTLPGLARNPPAALMAQGKKWLLCGVQAAQHSCERGCKSERNSAATKITTGTVAIWTATTAVLREKGHILTFLLIHWQGRNSVCITVWAASLGMVSSSKVIRLIQQKCLETWFWKCIWMRKDIRANSSSIIRVWHEETCCCIFQLAVNSLPMHSCLVLDVLQHAHLGWLN